MILSQHVAAQLIAPVGAGLPRPCRFGRNQLWFHDKSGTYVISEAEEVYMRRAKKTSSKWTMQGIDNYVTIKVKMKGNR